MTAKSVTRQHALRFVRELWGTCPVDISTNLLKTTSFSGEDVQVKANLKSGSQETLMDDSNRSGRRRFLKQAAALAGVGVGAGAGAEWAARGQPGKPETTAKDAHVSGEHLLRGTLPRRGAR